MVMIDEKTDNQKNLHTDSHCREHHIDVDGDQQYGHNLQADGHGDK